MDSIATFQDPTVISNSVDISQGLNTACGGSFGCEVDKVWLFNSSYVLIVNAINSRCLQRWKCNYGRIRRVYEVLCNTTTFLVIVSTPMEQKTDNDVITLLNPSSLSVVKSIYFCENVASLCSVNHSCASDSILNTFSGILAVGCYGGRVFLLNLNLDQMFVIHQPLNTRVITRNSNGYSQMEHAALELLQGIHEC